MRVIEFILKFIEIFRYNKISVAFILLTSLRFIYTYVFFNEQFVQRIALLRFYLK